MKWILSLLFIGWRYSESTMVLDHCPEGTTENLLNDVERIPDSAITSSTVTAAIRSGEAWVVEVKEGETPSVTVELTQTPVDGGPLVTMVKLTSDAAILIEYKSPATNNQFVLLSVLSDGSWNHRHEFRLNKDTEMTAIRLSLLRPMNSGQTHYHAYGLRITGCDKRVIESADEVAKETDFWEDIEW